MASFPESDHPCFHAIHLPFCFDYSDQTKICQYWTCRAGKSILQNSQEEPGKFFNSPTVRCSGSRRPQKCSFFILAHILSQRALSWQRRRRCSCSDGCHTAGPPPGRPRWCTGNPGPSGGSASTAYRYLLSRSPHNRYRYPSQFPRPAEGREPRRSAAGTHTAAPSPRCTLRRKYSGNPEI